jgi:hypothetical protein
MTNVLKRLGYGGSGLIGAKQVLVTGGSLDVAYTIAYLQPLDIAPTNDPRSRVTHADGTEAYSGNLSFDVTDNFLAELTTSKLFMRRYKFNVGYNDGQDSWGMKDCYLTSLSISGAAGGLLAGTISVVSVNAPESPVTSFTMPDAYIGFQGGSVSDLPLGYWYSGNTNVKDWNLTMNQEVTPVYLNKDATTPRYLKAGIVTYILQVTTYEQIYNYATINISTTSFTLVGGQTAKGSSYGGQSELGGYTNTFETAADATTGSGAVVIS